MERKSDKLLHLILIYVVLSGITYWLPTIRGIIDGPSYSWSGWMGIGGTGVGGHYWLLIIFTSLLIAVVFFGWRGIHKSFRWLLLTWFILLVIESGTWFFSSESIHFKGDTLVFDWSIGKGIFFIDLLFLALACIWIFRNMRLKNPPHIPLWNRLNRNLLILFFCIVPLQIFFLRFFDHYQIFDQIGVFLTICQWILLNLSFYPWKIQSEKS